MRPPMAFVLEAGGLSREDDDHVPPKDALCLWRGMLELTPVGMSTTTRLVLISPSASALPSGFVEPSGFWFSAPVSLWPGHGPLWKLFYPQGCFVCCFPWASTIHPAERETVPGQAACRKALMHSLQGHVSDLPDFSTGSGGGWISAGCGGGSSGLCTSLLKRGQSSPISQMNEPRLRDLKSQV